MAQSLSKVYVHITFSTKHRKPLIDKKIQTQLFDYLGGVCKALKCNPIRVGGYSDHIHILCILAKGITQIKLLEEVKRQSSKWIKTQGEEYHNFYWQSGYDCFSVNPSETDIVVEYIVTYGIKRILPFQGGDSGGELFTGRCPELMILPFQGNF